MIEATERVVFRNRLDERNRPFDLAADVRAGLTAERKNLPPKYFYDARGSELFEEITRLPEYYLTRAERSILEELAPLLIAELRPLALVELGSGSASKTRILLDAMRKEGLLEAYGSVDVSDDASRQAAEALIVRYPGLIVHSVIGDFEAEMMLPFADRPRLIAFLGSTIGNLTPRGATAVLGNVRGQMGSEDGFLIGFDLVKDSSRLERAYNDAAGVTAEFNLNLLRVINRELDADFDLTAFAHRAFYSSEEARIEMHLVSLRPQMVRVDALDLCVEFREGETILTELSHKYTRDSVASLLESGGLRLARWETDGKRDFGLGLARPS
ncbi:MAG: L-histidine N(alpha)-methyltransferase [Gemmatimonadota bacterium]